MTVCTVSDTGLITTNTGIILPSAGGTATTLNYNGVETITFHMSGSVSAPIDFPVTFSRVGKSVTMKWTGIVAAVTASSQQLVSVETVPTRFLPTYVNSPVYAVYGIDGAAPDSRTLCAIAFGSGQQLVITPSNFGFFNNAFCGIMDSSISYIVP
jgi:hypothetical protein